MGRKLATFDERDIREEVDQRGEEAGSSSKDSNYPPKKKRKK